MRREKKALLVCSDFIGWERKPVLAVVTSKICQALMQKGWKIALLTLSGNALHQDFLSEDERRKEFLEAIPDVVIYATKGGFPSPLDILRYLKNRKRTISAKGVNFSLSRTKSGRSYPLFRDFVAWYGKSLCDKIGGTTNEKNRCSPNIYRCSGGRGRIFA